ncbi:MAG: GNAT family N-acetyltransferase [Candidatus Limnocylindrales bacterium]
MSDPPLERPATARPREDPDALAVPLPPDRAELEGIGRQFLALWELAGATVAHEPDLGVDLVTWPGRGLAFNHGARPRWSDEDWRGQAERLAARLAGTGQVPAVVVIDELDRPTGLAERLRGVGWLELSRETVLWTRRAAVVPHLDPALRIEAVTPRRARAYEALERVIFGLSPLEAEDRLEALRRGLEGGALRAYLVRLGDEPIATARLLRGDGLAVLQGVGVAPQRRRHGYGTLITTIATRAGLAGGARLVWLSVEATNAGARTLYEGLDYRPALTWRRLIFPGANPPGTKEIGAS